MVHPHGKGRMIMEVCGASYRNSEMAYTRGRADRCQHLLIEMVNQSWTIGGIQDLMPSTRLERHVAIHLVTHRAALCHIFPSLCENSDPMTGDQRSSRCKRWSLEFALANLKPVRGLDCEASRNRRAAVTVTISCVINMKAKGVRRTICWTTRKRIDIVNG